MELTELVKIIDGALLLSPPAGRPVTCGFTCDMLSLVMARGARGMAWVTVQTHLNVIAVASLHEMACVILPDNIRMESAVLEKAREEGIAVVSSALSAYAICGRLAGEGLPSV